MIKRAVGGAGFIWLIVMGLGGQSLPPGKTTDWRPIGPPGAQVQSVAISGNDPDHAFIVVADPIRDSSLYETKNGGESWQLVDIRTGPCFRVAWAEDAARSIYALQEDGLIRSRDEGASWQFLPIGFQGWNFAGNSRIALAPSPRSETLWITGTYDRNGPKPAILESTSGGDTWSLRELPGVGPTLAAAFYRGNPDLVYVSTGNRILRSSNGGGAWEEVTLISSPQILIDPNNENILYITSNGIRRSLDAGRTWKMVMDRAWLLADYLSPQGILFAAANGRIFRSADRGETWKGTARAEFGGANDIAVSPSRVLFATDLGIHASDDGGTTWRDIHHGLSGQFISAVAAAPSAPRVIYASTEGIGLYRTDDRGELWRRLPDFPGDGTVSKILVEASDSERVYVLLDSSSDGGVAISENGGLTWTRGSITQLTDLFLSPHQRGALLATGRSEEGARFHRSFDGGATWETAVVSSGYMDRAVGIAQDSVDPSVIYSVSYSAEGPFLIRSEDTGLTWTRIGAKLNDGIDLLALDPASRTADGRRNSRIYLAGWEGVFRSDDEGATKTRVFDFVVRNLIVDPIRTDRVYISMDGAAWVSASYDRGASWTYPRPESGELHNATSLSFDPVGRVLYAGTKGGGIYANERIDDHLFPPRDVRAVVKLNRSLALREYVHVLSWADDPRNPPLAAYQIMARETDPENVLAVEEFVSVDEVPASTKQIMRRGTDPKHIYDYIVRGVDGAGRTTAWTGAEIRPVDSPKGRRAESRFRIESK